MHSGWWPLILISIMDGEAVDTKVEKSYKFYWFESWYGYEYVYITNYKRFPSRVSKNWKWGAKNKFNEAIIKQMEEGAYKPLTLKYKEYFYKVELVLTSQINAKHLLFCLIYVV